MLDSTIDYVIIALCLTGALVFGIISGGKYKSIKDYFLRAECVTWQVVCSSIPAAEISTMYKSFSELGYFIILILLFAAGRTIFREYGIEFIVPALGILSPVIIYYNIKKQIIPVEYDK